MVWRSSDAMKRLVILFVLAYEPCSSRSLPEDSVVSVYTTLPTTAGTHPNIDVYHQIANNIAERITSPIYRFLGISKNKTDEKTTKRTWENIELLDEPEDTTHPNYLPVDNDIEDRDVEELSVEAMKKDRDRKPEKITLYNSYLPVLSKIGNNLPILGKLESFDDDKNETSTEAGRRSDDDFDDDDGLTLDDVEQEEGREGYFYYILEILGSIIQLAWGGLLGLFGQKNK